MERIEKICALAAAIAVLLLFTGCSNQPDAFDNNIEDESELPTLVVMELITATSVYEENVDSTPTEREMEWTEEELQAIALTLAGECYDDKTEDKRLVCEVILNRVSDGRFGGETVLEVLTEENQFDGYWSQPRSVTENDLVVAEKALSDWYKNDCAPLSEYLYFCAGDNRENVFRSDY